MFTLAIHKTYKRLGPCWLRQVRSHVLLDVTSALRITCCEHVALQSQAISRFKKSENIVHSLLCPVTTRRDNVVQQTADPATQLASLSAQQQLPLDAVAASLRNKFYCIITGSWRFKSGSVVSSQRTLATMLADLSRNESLHRHRMHLYVFAKCSKRDVAKWQLQWPSAVSHLRRAASSKCLQKRQSAACPQSRITRMTSSIMLVQERLSTPFCPYQLNSLLHI